MCSFQIWLSDMNLASSWECCWCGCRHCGALEVTKALHRQECSWIFVCCPCIQNEPVSPRNFCAHTEAHKGYGMRLHLCAMLCCSLCIKKCRREAHGAPPWASCPLATRGSGSIQVGAAESQPVWSTRPQLMRAVASAHRFNVGRGITLHTHTHVE